MVKINANFSKLNAALKQVGAELNFRYHFVNNKSKIASTRKKFKTDGTLDSIENLQIDFFAGLTFYQNNFVAIYKQCLENLIWTHNKDYIIAYMRLFEMTINKIKNQYPKNILTINL